MQRLIGAILTAGLLISCASVDTQSTAAKDVLPSSDLSAYLSEVETVSTRGDDAFVNLDISNVSVDSIYKDAVDAAAERGEVVGLPLQTANEMVVLLRPDLSAEEAAGALSAVRALPSDCDASEVLPQIGAVVVTCADIRQGAEWSTLAETRAAQINQLADRLRADPRFAAVTANTVMSSTSIVSAILPETDRSGEEMGENADWGVAASKIDQLWPLLTRSVQVGVIDVGFAAHSDLPLSQGLPDQWRPLDHGNHVAGIMCARHNGAGVKGVLPNCNVAAASGEFLLGTASPLETDGIIAFQARFSEYIATVLSFIEANPNAKVVNISLGYNWMPNFGLDPRLNANAEVRDLVRGQGRIFQAILAYAKRRDVAIFSAAGNDSTSLQTPLEAEWASPFNFGAQLATETDGWSNGVVVEAYAQNNRRASFSNSNGDITCPGVDIRSAIARPVNAYGTMSGTSMASPYCAAGFAALRSLLPQVSLERALQCYLGVSGRVSGVPKMDLKAAFEACRDSQ